MQLNELEGNTGGFELQTSNIPCSYQPYNVQPRTKYLRKSLVSMWNSTLREKFNFYFQRFFC